MNFSTQSRYQTVARIDRYQVAYYIHWEPNPHIHMIVNRVSFVDGKKYPDRFADRQAFWQHVRYVLNGYGIFLCK
mgnify:CR=1 FL=1